MVDSAAAVANPVPGPDIPSVNDRVTESLVEVCNEAEGSSGTMTLRPSR